MCQVEAEALAEWRLAGPGLLISHHEQGRYSSPAGKGGALPALLHRSFYSLSSPRSFSSSHSKRSPCFRSWLSSFLYAQELIPSPEGQLRWQQSQEHQDRSQSRAGQDPHARLCFQHCLTPSLPVCNTSQRLPQPPVEAKRWPHMFRALDLALPVCQVPERGEMRCSAGIWHAIPSARSIILSVLPFKAGYKILMLASNKCQSAAKQEILWAWGYFYRYTNRRREAPSAV